MRADDIALIGFGEAAETFVVGWGRGGIRAFDVKSRDPALAGGLAARYAARGVVAGQGPEVVAGAGLVFCLVTADQAVAAAEMAAPHLAAGAMWFDGNSCSPGAKRAAARVIEAAGAVYVDMAIMAPVRPLGHRTPLLVSGHGAAAERLGELGMVAAVAGPGVGDASTIKMLRSVMVKGFEALTAECVLAARRAGVERAVLASLAASDPGIDWETRAAYNLERMMVHGARRASEMREVAATLRELGLPDRMAAAAAEWQAEVAGLGLAPGPDEVGARADIVLAGLG